MPITIGTLTSNVEVREGGPALTEELLERIVRMAVARLKEEWHAEKAWRREGEIHNRRAEGDPF